MKINIKKALNKELDAIVPALNEEIMNRPVEREETQPELAVEANVGGVKGFFSVKKPFVYILAAIVMAVAAVLFIPVSKKDVFGGTVLILEINPCLKILSDSDDKVTAVISGNSDGDVILYDNDFNDALIGKSSEEVLTLLVDRAVEFGYITDSTEKSTVTVSVVSEERNAGTVKAETYNGKLVSYLCGKGIYAVVRTESVTLDEYDKKYSTENRSVKELFDSLKNGPQMSYETEKAVDKDIFDRYVSSYKSFIDELARNYCKILIQKHEDILSLKIKYGMLESCGIDGFGPGNDAGVIYKSVYEDFRAAAEAFENRYGEKLSESRLNELYELYSGLLNDKIIGDVQSLIEQEIKTVSDIESINSMLLSITEDAAVKASMTKTLGKFTVLPDSEEKLKEITSEMIKARAEIQKQNANEFYNSPKDPISDDKYKEYLDQIKKRFFGHAQ